MKLFRKNVPQTVTEKEETRNLQEELYPVLYSKRYMTDRLEELSEQEMNISREILNIKKSFGSALDSMENLSSEVDTFHESFQEVDQVVGRFADVEKKIIDSIEDAQKQIQVLKTDSAKAGESFAMMDQNFSILQETVNEIKNTTGGIIAVANQTNLLALNASIEAARAGEQGKGFTVVAEQVGKLSDEIKNLVEQVNASVRNVEEKTNELNEAMQASKQALEVSQTGVDEATETFDKVKEATHEVETVQQNVSAVLTESQKGIAEVKEYVTLSRNQYDKILTYIESIDSCDNKKSAMFEDIRNMLMQIEPLAKSVQ